MLLVELKESSVLKEAVASLANMNGDQAFIYYNEYRLSLCVCNVSMHNLRLMAVLHLRRSSFKIFYCGKAAHIRINLNRFSELLNRATDDEAIMISFGRMKTYQGHNTIKFRFEDLGTGQTRLFEMKFSKDERIALDRHEWLYNYQVVSIPAQEFIRVFTELDIPGSPSASGLRYFITISNEQLKFSKQDREVIFTREKGEYEIQGIEIEQQIRQGHRVALVSSYLWAARMTNKVWLLNYNKRGRWSALLKCQIGRLGDVIFDMYPRSMAIRASSVN